MSFRPSAQFHMPSFSTANRHHKVHYHSILLSQGISICSFVIIDMARMSVFGFWALILLAGTACLSSTYSSSHGDCIWDSLLVAKPCSSDDELSLANSITIQAMNPLDH
ncbi:hypothetical protein POTOM_033130 [Populus tomentosa]|uniref:Uncharacterized protein n=1 Tax=Populus tomentosa TaxID=118781 RepID=A0A8X7Z815_POPTO|nr:hypothetical protein POTOM_033130 [Populus tomentosa]